MKVAPKLRGQLVSARIEEIGLITRTVQVRGAAYTERAEETMTRLLSEMMAAANNPKEDRWATEEEAFGPPPQRNLARRRAGCAGRPAASARTEYRVSA